MNMVDTQSSFDIPELKLFKQGKVRYVYDLDDHLLLIATDRVSAFDTVLPTSIPLKGRVLTQLSEFWFNKTSHMLENHLLSTEFSDFPKEIDRYRSLLEHRTMLVKRTQLIEIECVVRGYLTGSGWKEYQVSQTVCGEALPRGLRESEKLENPIFTPATKAATGHDENISIEKMKSIIGEDLGTELIDKSLKLYEYARDFAEERGLLLADTKFEFGILNDKVILIDEVLTPDSSRYWLLKDYQPGKAQDGFDKQFVRDYLLSINWNKKPPVPELPTEIVQGTQKRYLELYTMLTGKELDE